MVYLKSILAGIGGSILALILFLIVMFAIYVPRLGGQGEVGISVVGPIPISVAALGFTVAFYLVYRNSN